MPVFHLYSSVHIDAENLISAAGVIRTLSQSLKFVVHRRYSSSQDTDIQLCGIIGNLEWTNVPEGILDLMHLASIFHLGRHTSEGCGMIECRPVHA